MKVLLTGGSGKLGSEIIKLDGDVYAPTRDELDVTDLKQILNVVGEYVPTHIIHCAAYTDVARSEVERDLCWKTNVVGTKNMLFARDLLTKAHFTYVSTACVFKGDRGGYTEFDLPHPTNFYGLTKLLGEVMTRNAYPQLLNSRLVVRTNFVSRKMWPHQYAFTDRFGTYLYADEVAEQVLKLARRGEHGLIHVCGEEKLNMYELAKKTSPNVKPLTLEQYYMLHPTSAKLTVDMSLKSVIL